MRIAVVEDNRMLADAIGKSLGDDGHGVDILHNGDEADGFLAREAVDAVVLDINLPGLSGLDVLSGMRRRGDTTPVILLTARGETKDRIRGLDAGADDYLVKPFDMDELSARLRALLRRRGAEQTNAIAVADLTLDRTARRLFNRDVPLELPRRELALAELFLLRLDQIVSKEQILDHLYGGGSDVDATAAELYVHRLRKRLAGSGVAIKTVRGLGYFMEKDQ